MQYEADRLISVIVPVFNAEPWLGKCIESICKQSYRALEIILVDDGSADHSPGICGQYAARDPRIRVISKPHSGVSDSRNAGIQAARGTYITFVDADDYLPEDILEKAVRAMEGDSTRLCAWNAACVRGGSVIQEPPVDEGLIDSKIAAAAVIYDRCAGRSLGRYFRASWAKLYCAEIIKENRIAFSTRQRIGEDALFLLEYLKYAAHITVLNTVGYFYRITETSAVRRYREDLLEQSQLQLDAICSYLEKDPALKEGAGTALTCLAWDMFRRLIRNQRIGKGPAKERKQDARIWYKRNSAILRDKTISRKDMPKTTKLQYFLSAWLPSGALCAVSAVLEGGKREHF